jgi:cytidylate kinase
MIIAIAGLTGSGKNTLGEILAEKTKMEIVCPTFKDLADKEGITLMEFQEKAAKDPKIDLKFDEVLKQKTKKGDCIVTTWLGPWVVDADLRVYVFAPLDVRAKRIAKRDDMTLEEATKHIKARDEQNRKRYLKVYGIDICDTANFDICLNSGIYRPEQMAEIVLQLAEVKKKK